MQVSVESLSKVERRLTVVVPSQRVEQAFDSQLQQFAKKVDVKGFRPGKVPLDIVKQRFGYEVRSEAINTVIQETLNEAIRQEKLYPISTPRIEAKPGTPEKGLEYTATFDVLPEVGEVKFKSGKLEKLIASVKDEDIQKTLDRVREQNVVWKKVDRAAKEKDKINGKIQMIQDDGKPLTPESMPLEFVIKDEASLFGWNLLEKLQGAKVGETVKFKHTLPQESFLQGMSGKNMEFVIEIVEINEPHLPEMNEDFAKKLGIKTGSMDELRSEIRKQLEINAKRAVKGLLKEKVFEQLIEQNPLEIPASLVQREAKHLHDENCSMSQHGQHQHSKEDEVHFADNAKKRIHLGLLVGEVTTKDKIKPTAERVDQYIADLASAYADGEEYTRRIKADKRNLKEIEAYVLEEMIVEKLLENVSIVEKEVSYEELITSKQA